MSTKKSSPEPLPKKHNNCTEVTVNKPRTSVDKANKCLLALANRSGIYVEKQGMKKKLTGPTPRHNRRACRTSMRGVESLEPEALICLHDRGKREICSTIEV